MFKKILAAIGGILLLVGGVLLGRGVLARRRVGADGSGRRGVGPTIRGADRDLEDIQNGIANAGSGVESVAEQLGVSADRADEIGDGFERIEANAERGRAILARRKARHNSKLDI